ncbi:NUDIX domain-containing protein [endosymbiont 'TC1' of Trimyema compressum]|uniref:NUDIX domain-containing protein n=1 Tax=endosymbiont 'TC1' of Trimyema compressum TaxID=243899 RepID=UPI00139235F8
MPYGSYFGKTIKPKTHHFTHKTWHLTLYPIKLSKKIEAPNIFWIKKEDINTLSIPTAFKKLL